MNLGQNFSSFSDLPGFYNFLSSKLGFIWNMQRFFPLLLPFILCMTQCIIFNLIYCLVFPSLLNDNFEFIVIYPKTQVFSLYESKYKKVVIEKLILARRMSAQFLFLKIEYLFPFSLFKQWRVLSGNTAFHFTLTQNKRNIFSRKRFVRI